VIKNLASFIFRVLGWKVVGEIPKGIKKYIVIAAPHTSNWDFLYGFLYFNILDIQLNFFMKKEWFFFPVGWFLRSIGGVPVDRSKKEDLTTKIVEKFNSLEELALFVTPEGTRSFNPNWKKGFYHMAEKADVPMVLGFLDYSKRIAGVGPIYKATGDIDKDIEIIKEFYRGIKGRFPEKGVV
jgi:1-acyl-sn-glycerol-3-phosphate acyltransferase